MTQTQNDSQQNPAKAGVRTYTGGCHCGAVRYEATVNLADVSRCNCTFCTKYGDGGSTSMKPEAFRLLKGQEDVTQYARKGSPNSRSFCKHCGVMCFGAGDVPELGGAFRSIHIGTLDDVDPSLLTYQYWDGRHDNWMAGSRSSPWPFQATVS
ncbi:GFA family protein [Corallococcus sp. ZKHCc1 1396]|uniref:GFA family protein n=1 Tax=Corallococcus soli TaxID=2710757 RepID=A0ABR9PIT9_9BACT|nr:GFA family protein [Corallococcus soli]MBE4747837.1 GFA family protein [Corallococcus soli]